MSSLPAPIRIAQTIGITTSAWVAGSILSISLLSVPALLLAPSPVLARQWQTTFDRGKIVNPAVALISVFEYSFLSYKLYGTLNHSKAECYAISALLTFGIFPWTTFAMMPTNKKLFKKYDEMKNLGVEEKATELGLSKGESTKELVDRWGVLNVFRSLFPLAGTVIGLWGSLH